MKKPFKDFSKIKDELSSILPSSFISPLLSTVGTSNSGTTPTNPYVASLFDEFVGMIGNFNSKARNLQDLTKNIEDFSVIGKVKVDIWCTDNYNAPGSGIRCSAVWMQEEYLRNPYIVVKITLNNQYAFVYQRVIVPSTKILGAAQGDPTLIYAWGRGCWGQGQTWANEVSDLGACYVNLTGSQILDQYQAFAFPMVFKHLFNTTVNCSAIGYQGPNSAGCGFDNSVGGLLYGVSAINSYAADLGYNLLEISPTGGIVNLNDFNDPSNPVNWSRNPYTFGCAVSAWGMVDIDAIPGSNSCNNGNSKWVTASSLYPWYDLTNLYPEGKNYLSAGDSFSLTFNLLCLQAQYNTIGIKQVPGWVVTALPSWITINTGAVRTSNTPDNLGGLGDISGTVPAVTDANYQTGVLNFSVMVGDGSFSMAEIPLSIQIGDPTLPENQGTIPLVGGYVDPTKPAYGYNITLDLNTSQVLSGYTAANNQDMWSTNSLSRGLADELIEGLNPSPTLIISPYGGTGWNGTQNIEYWYLACTAPNGVAIDPGGNINSSSSYPDAYTNWAQWMNFNTGQVQYMTTQGNPSSSNFPITQMVSSSFIPSTSYPYMPRSLVSPSFPQGIEWDQGNCIGMTSSSTAGSMWDSTTAATILRREGFFTTNFMVTVSDGLITQSSIIQLYWDLIPNNYQRLVRYPDEDYVLPTVTWEYSQIPSSWPITGMNNCIPLPSTTQLQEYIDQNPDDFPIAQLLCSLSVTEDDEHQFLNPQMAGRPPLPNKLYINGTLTEDSQNAPAPVIYQLFQGTYDVQPLTPDNTIVLKGSGRLGSYSSTSTNQYPPLVTANYDSSAITWNDVTTEVGPLLQFGLGQMPESVSQLIWVINPYTGTITINLNLMRDWLTQNPQVPSYSVSNENGDFTFYCLKPVIFYSDYFVCYQPLQLEIWFALPNEPTSTPTISSDSGGGNSVSPQNSIPTVSELISFPSSSASCFYNQWLGNSNPNTKSAYYGSGIIFNSVFPSGITGGDVIGVVNPINSSASTVAEAFPGYTQFTSTPPLFQINYFIVNGKKSTFSPFNVGEIYNEELVDQGVGVAPLSNQEICNPPYNFNFYGMQSSWTTYSTPYQSDYYALGIKMVDNQYANINLTMSSGAISFGWISGSEGSRASFPSEGVYVSFTIISTSSVAGDTPLSNLSGTTLFAANYWNTEILVKLEAPSSWSNP